MEPQVFFEDLKGKVLTSISGKVGYDRITFVTDTGTKFELYHDRDCCESVEVEDIAGDLHDLIAAPILLAEEVTSNTNPDGTAIDLSDQYSFTWTFYKLSTIKGSVTIRWYGQSNGYYSESVNFREID